MMKSLIDCHNTIPDDAIFVMDGGYILHAVVWPKRSTYQADQHTKLCVRLTKPTSSNISMKVPQLSLMDMPDLHQPSQQSKTDEQIPALLQIL